ncbi:MAG: nucleoside 2-deoxyribosyltransferase domain-containing protein [Acidobacteriota bacterium]
MVFLGGACGRTTWRRDVAIPLLEAAGVAYYNPQLGVGEWTTACEAAEMRAKAEADVLLFVISGETRGVASIGEASYLIGAKRPLALMVTDSEASDKAERDDLNRGRIFLRSMAKEHDVPVFTDVAAATHYAIELVRAGAGRDQVREVLNEARFKDEAYVIEEIDGGYLIQLRCTETDVATSAREMYRGRQWYIRRGAGRGEIVRTAFLAAAVWQEHEARESFTYRGARIFGPHGDVDELASKG